MKKIAVPITNNDQIDDHFGHCEYYGIYTISEQNEIVEVQSIKSEQGCGCKSNIASVLSENGVGIMLAGGIGAGAINVLNKWGIQVVRGCTGNAINIVQQFIDEQISDSGESCLSHKHDSEHVCKH